MGSRLDRAAYEALGDPLSSATRSAKKTVYVFATLCVLVAYTGVVPQDPSIAGFRFPGLTEDVIRYALLLLTIFSLISFLSGLIPDILRYIHLVDAYKLRRAGEIDDAIHTDPYTAHEEEFREREFESKTGYKPPKVPEWLIVWSQRLRFFLDSVFPVIYAVGGLAYFACR